MDLNKIRKNSTLTDNGDWVDKIPGMGDLRLKVRGNNSKIVRKALATKAAASIENQSDDNRDVVVNELYHEVVLLDWDNLMHDGKKLKYSAELAKEWLTNPDYDDFAQAVEYASMQVAKRSKEAMEGLSKN